MSKARWMYSPTKNFYRSGFCDEGETREDAIGELRALYGHGYIAKGRPMVLDVPLDIEDIVQRTIEDAGGEYPWGEDVEVGPLELLCAPHVAKIVELVREHISTEAGDLWEPYEIERVERLAPFSTEITDDGVRLTFLGTPSHLSWPVLDFAHDLRAYPVVTVDVRNVKYLDSAWVDDFLCQLKGRVRVVHANESVREYLTQHMPSAELVEEATDGQ